MSGVKNLSILIPVYNYDIRNLVKNLSDQASRLSIPVEIICIDDFSQESYKMVNKEVADYPYVCYFEEQFNRGRTSIRNYLTHKASFEYILFLDCDSTIVSEDFLQKYIAAPDAEVKVGGTVYTTQAPDDWTYRLHWLAGSKREARPATERKKAPYSSLTVNNIFIKKKVFQKVLLNEAIKGYGHEDTLFGMDLKANNINLLHIDNPVLHAGLNDFNSYLSKTREGLRNLHLILQMQDTPIHTNLLNLYTTLKKYRCIGLVRFILGLIYPILLKNLQSKSPSLLAFDLFKLKEFIDIEQS
jgi:glycosyltransferase involved in cell wall biosynthesis